MKDRKVAGLWIDTQKAILVKNHDAQNTSDFKLCEPIKAEVQGWNSSEKNANNAEQTNRMKFFKEIDHMIENTEELYITGPGQVQEELKRYLHETAQFKNLKITLDTAQHMSDEEVLETVKKHFGE